MAEIPLHVIRAFDAHGVPSQDRQFLFAAFDRLIEEDIDHIDEAEASEKAVLAADSYEELLQQHNRGHRRNKTWFRAEAFSDAVPTKRGRGLLRDFVTRGPAEGAR